MIWPFNLLSKKTPKKIEVPPFKRLCYIKDGVQWTYKPAPDITAYEVALIAPAMYNAFIRFDYMAYFEEHNLMRHFVRTEDEI